MFKFGSKKKAKEQDDIEWMIDKYRASIERRRTNISRFHAEGDVDLLFTNHLNQVDDFAGLSLALWRQRQDPRDSIRGLIDQYDQLQAHFLHYDPNDELGLRSNFDFHDTDLMDALGWLAGITSKVTTVPDPKANFFFSCSNYLLRQSVGVAGSDEDREGFLAQLKSGNPLPVRILSDRAKILGVVDTDETLETLVKRSEGSWEERRNSSFFKEYGRRSGYSGSNYRDLDYYLAAALKRVGYEGETIHQWIW